MMRVLQDFGRRSSPYLFILPNILLILVFSVFPLLYSIALSLREWRITGTTFVGLVNYGRLTSDPLLWIAFRNTLYYAVVSVPTGVSLGLVLALVVNQPLRGRVLIRGLYLMPHLLSWVVVGLIWQWLFSPNYGILNSLLGYFGFPAQRWLQNSSFTIPGLGIATVWANAGYFMVIYLAGLQSIPEEYYEAAKCDGAGSWARFWRITLPLLRPVTFFVLVIAVIQTLRAFDLVYVLTGGGPGRASLLLVLYIYDRAFEGLEMGYASAVAVVLFLAILLLTLVQVRVFRGGAPD